MRGASALRADNTEQHRRQPYRSPPGWRTAGAPAEIMLQGLKWQKVHGSAKKWQKVLAAQKKRLTLQAIKADQMDETKNYYISGINRLSGRRERCSSYMSKAAAEERLAALRKERRPRRAFTRLQVARREPIQLTLAFSDYDT